MVFAVAASVAVAVAEKSGKIRGSDMLFVVFTVCVCVCVLCVVRAFKPAVNGMFVLTE